MKLATLRGLTAISPVNSRYGELWAGMQFEDATEGHRPVKELPTGEDTAAYCVLQVPLDFHVLLSADFVVIPEGTGTIVWQAATSFGKVCSDEQEDAHTDSVGRTVRAVTNDELECLDLGAAFTGLGVGDNVGVQVTRVGTDQEDALEATVNAVGLRVRYT